MKNNFLIDLGQFENVENVENFQCGFYVNITQQMQCVSEESAMFGFFMIAFDAVK